MLCRISSRNEILETLTDMRDFVTEGSRCIKNVVFEVKNNMVRFGQIQYNKNSHCERQDSVENGEKSNGGIWRGSRRLGRKLYGRGT